MSAQKNPPNRMQMALENLPDLLLLRTQAGWTHGHTEARGTGSRSRALPHGIAIRLTSGGWRNPDTRPGEDGT